MSYDLRTLLGTTYLTSYIQSVVGGGGADTINPAFLSLTEQGDTDVAEWQQRKMNRQTATIVNKGNPSRKVTEKDVEVRTAKCVHAFEHMAHKAATIEGLKSTSGVLQAKGADHVKFQTEEFARRFDNLRVATICSMLSLGACYFDRNGNMLPSSSGAYQTVDFGVPSGNKSTLNVFGAGALIGASWGTASTNIAAQVLSIIDAGVQLSGHVIEEAYYGANILGYFAANTNALAWMQSNNMVTTALAGNTIPDGFLGIKKWYPASRWFYEDQDGTVRQWITGDQVVFTPKPDRSWYSLFEGVNLVPSGTNQAYADAMAALNGLSVQPGKSSWARVSDDPPGILHYGMDTFLPLLKNPNAIFIADVVP